MLVSWVKFGSCWGLIRFMWVSRDKFWSSWGLKQDLDDSFTFLSHFMLVFWDQFGSSWGLKPDLDDIFTFLSRFMKSEAERSVPGGNRLLIFWPPWGTMGSKMMANMWSKMGPKIGAILGSFFNMFCNQLLRAKTWFWRQFHVFKLFWGSHRLAGWSRVIWAVDFLASMGDDGAYDCGQEVVQNGA